MKRVFEFPDVHIKNANLLFDLSMARFERQYTKAQYELDSMVMTDMMPFMPFVTGTFMKLTQARSQAIAGSGYVYAAAPPYGRFLYFGKTMVSPTTGSTWAEAGEKKVLVSQYGGKTKAKENLTYNSKFHPRVTAKWYDAAKRANGNKWIRLAKRKAGGGNG